MNQNNFSDPSSNHHDEHDPDRSDQPPAPGSSPRDPGSDVQQPYGPYGPQYLRKDAYHPNPYAAAEGERGEPRNDPRWVYSQHDSRDETREIPYFDHSGHPGVDESYYLPYGVTPQRRRGPLNFFITTAALLGVVFLAITLLSQIFDWDRDDNPIQDLFSSQPEAPEVVPEGQATVEGLVSELDHVHNGVDVNWEAGGQHTGSSLDPGQEVRSAPGVFMVDTQVYQYLGFGTGMVVSSDGLAITNYHVVESSMSVSITMADTQEQYSAEVLGRDADRDIAVLKIDTDEPIQVASINPEGVDTRDTVAGVGNSGGQGYLTSVVGEVRGLNETIHIEPVEPGSPDQTLEGLIMMTSDIVPGYSGGPTVDSNGQVIGVSTAASQEAQTSEDTFGFAVPIVDALEVVEQVLAGDESGGVVIGAGGALGIVVTSQEGSGARVIEVSDGSAGDAIGLQPDDVIVEIDGEEVVNSSFISRYVRDKNPGQEVEVVWQTSDGNMQRAVATLDEAEIN